MVEHCSDLTGDRALGARWEREFCKLAALHGKMFTAHQIGRYRSAVAYSYSKGNGYHPLTLPDITLWTAPGEHHEIKHKNPTKSDCFGLEDYRLRALKWFSDETSQTVFYTIHNWDLAGERNGALNRIDDWVTITVGELSQATLDGRAQKARYPSWVAGNKKVVDGWFWPTALWRPLVSIWPGPPPTDSDQNHIKADAPPD